MSNLGVGRFLLVALLLISSHDLLRVSCDAVGAQVEQQQQQQLQPVQPQIQPEKQQIQPQQQQSAVQPAVDASAQVSASTAPADPAGAASAASAAGVASPAASAAAASTAVAAVGDELKNWQQSSFYLALFDPAITSIPAMQRDFVNKMVVNDLELFREIVREAIERRNKFAPSVGLIWKYAGKVLGRMISNRREELRLPERLEPKPDFFRMLADIADAIIQRSAEVKREKAYSKSTIDTEELYRRTDSVFRYVQSTIEAAPVAAYLKWNELILFKNDSTNADHDRPLVDLASDLVAQYRSMGYESCVFVGRRVVNLLRMFSRGSIPQSDKEV